MPVTRRGFISGAGAAAAAAVPAPIAKAQGSATAPTSAHWNVVVLISDDQRFDAMGAMLNHIVRTPNLDKLAARGALFASHFVTTSICPVSRSSMYLGQYAHRHKIWDFDTPMSEGQLELSYFHLLRDTHQVGFVGKWGIGDSEPPPVEHFDYWAGYSGQGEYFDTPEHKDRHITLRQTDQTIAFIDQAVAKKAPFALTLCYKAPHPQDGEIPEFQAAPEFADWYANETMPRPATATERHFERLPDFLRTSESRRRWQSRFGSEESFQETVRQYYRLISGVDASVGAIVDHLAKLGQLENTLILFTSDNGFMLGEHGLAGKWWMFEESIRVPLLICPPAALALPGGRLVNALTLNIDIYPTLLSALGKPIPSECQGRSIWPLIEGTASDVREDFYYEFFFEHPTIGKSEGVRTKSWKYIHWPKREAHGEMLFDLIDDPQEENDLAGDRRYSQRKAMLRQRMLTLKHELDP
jgi:arylsulfatase A-like enzyme